MINQPSGTEAASGKVASREWSSPPPRISWSGSLPVAAAVLATAMGPGAERIDLDGATLRGDPARLADEAASLSLFGDARHIRVTGMGEESLAAVAALLPTAAQLERSLQPVVLGAVTDRIGLPFVLRDLARRRRALQLTTPGGVLAGTVDRVGKDHLDLAVHPVDCWRRASAVARIEVLALAQVLLVRVD